VALTLGSRGSYILAVGLLVDGGAKLHGIIEHALR
jgi:hypothetical protein